MKEILMLWSLGLIFVVQIRGVEVEFAFDSQGGDEFYLGDRLTLTCTATGTDITRLAVRLNTSAERYQGCHYNAIDDTPWGGYTSHGDTGLIPLSDLQVPGCSSIGNSSGFDYTMSGVITEELRQYQGSAFYCQSRNKDRVNTMSNNSLVIGDLKVAPHDLVLNISTETVVEGEEFSFECKSFSDSSSVYKYEVVKASGEVVEAHTYAPDSTDREVLTVRCTDETHPNWRGGNTENSQTVRPHFIQVRDKPLNKVVLNMKTDNTLTCNISGYRTLNYSWTRNNGTNSRSLAVSKEVKLPAGSADGEWEEIICTATVDGTSLTAIMTWQIRWHPVNIPTATTLSTGLTDVTHTGTIAGGVIAGILCLVAASVVAVYCWKRKSAADKSSDSPQRLEPPAGESSQNIYSNDMQLAQIRPIDHAYQSLNLQSQADTTYSAPGSDYAPLAEGRMQDNDYANLGQVRLSAVTLTHRHAGGLGVEISSESAESHYGNITQIRAVREAANSNEVVDEDYQIPIQIAKLVRQ